MLVNINDLLNVYENEISKNIKNKKQVMNFEINKMQNISKIMLMLQKGEVGHKKYNIFLIYEPKCRLIMSLPILDKTINHYLTRYILEPKLTKYLDFRNCATRKNMGTDYGVKLVKKYLNIMKNKYPKFYVLKLDIQKYFYNINHEVLKDELKDILNDYEYNLITQIIDSTNASYINETIDKICLNRKYNIPRYEYNKGLPIGNMTSQFLSIFYLSGLDHYIIHNLKCKYYVRYMDDFIIMHNDYNYLKEVRDKIVYLLENKYKLNVNLKKTNITKEKEFFSFLGYSYKVVNNKIITKIRRANYEKIKKRIKKLKYDFDKGNIDYNNLFCSVMTYMHSYKYANNIKIKSIINKYIFDDQ